MATATLTSQLTDLLLDPGTPTAIGTGNVPGVETVIHLQGTGAATVGHAGAVGPTAPTAISEFRGIYNTVTAFTRTGMHLHIWVRDLYPVRNKNVGGVSIYTFGTSEALYYSNGADKGYAGGWYHAILNLDPTTRPAASLGTAPSTDITRIGYAGNISATKGEAFTQNCYYDAVRRGTGGQGITFTGGTSGDRLTIANCVAADTARYGLLQNIGGALFIEGCITFGSATATTYLQDNLKTLIFSGFEIANGTSGGTTVPAVASDYYRIVLADGTTGVTDIRLTDFVWSGFSRAIPFSFNAGALATGDAYVSVRSTYLFGSTITLNTLCTSTNDSFVECVTVIPGGITLTNPTFSNTDTVTLTATNDAISGGTVNKHNTTAGNAFITTNSLAKISNTAFDNTGGAGHAILINTIGTYTFTSNTFTGYGADASTSAAIYNNSGGLVTINVGGTGGTPTIRNGAGASTTVNVSVTVTVKAIDKSGVAIQFAQVSMYKISDNSLIFLQDTNASGIATTSYAGSTPVDVYFRVRKCSPGDTKYIPDSATGTIEASTGLSVTRTLSVDTNNTS